MIALLNNFVYCKAGRGAGGSRTFAKIRASSQREEVIEHLKEKKRHNAEIVAELCNPHRGTKP
jgi:hypothetical protein